ncbi:MAG: hypothetical protein ACE5JQ_09855 [Candidatus Methylomirabilales bacterium]
MSANLFALKGTFAFFMWCFRERDLTEGKKRMSKARRIPAPQLVSMVTDTRERTFELVKDLFCVLPFPGFVVDSPYKEYSGPWFGYRKVSKGGSWASRSRLACNTDHNFFLPYRCDLFAGFRTCAV